MDKVNHKKATYETQVVLSQKKTATERCLLSTYWVYWDLNKNDKCTADDCLDIRDNIYLKTNLFRKPNRNVQGRLVYSNNGLKMAQL